MDGLMAPRHMAPDALADLARRALAHLPGWSRHAATFGSAGSMVLAAMLGVATFAFALASPPVVSSTATRAAAWWPETGGADSRGRLTEISATGAMAATAVVTDARPDTLSDTLSDTLPDTLAPIGTPPPAAIETALDYDVVFYWPARPQTVAEPAAIREGPATYARVIRSAHPGERLRINGRVEEAPNGPWLRVRLADGQDGYFAAHTIDVGVFRQRRAVEATQVADTGVVVEAAGAPLLSSSPDAYGDPESGPPLF